MDTGPGVNSRQPVLMSASRLASVSITPLLSPVVPEVYTMVDSRDTSRS